MRVQNLITGSTPVVIHRNGNPPEWSQRWNAIVADFFQEPRDPCPPYQDLTILTCNSRPDSSLLERCLDHLHVPYVTLGRNLPAWRNDMKPYLVANELERVTSRYVMGLDSDDVLVLACAQHIVEAFESAGRDILFSSERTSAPEVPHLTEFEQAIAESVYGYLNAGAWIGRTDACRRFFQACMEEHNRDIVASQPAAHMFRAEQGLVRKTFQRFHPAAGLDYRCRIFQSLWGVALDGEIAVHAAAMGRAS